ncbi:MAG: hypothetical protein WAZ60_23790 [Desulfosalsimonadaceae bacterium]
MTRNPIPWSSLLGAYPGETVREKLCLAKQGKSFPVLAAELGVKVDAAKTIFYRSSRGRRLQTVCSRPRTDYRAIMGGLIEELAARRGLTPAAYREWINGTEDGELDFVWECFMRKIPVFTCNYQERKDS